MFQELNLDSDMLDANENYFASTCTLLIWIVLRWYRYLMSMLKWINRRLLMWVVSIY